jgi:uncharacterized phage-associated protein
MILAGGAVVTPPMPPRPPFGLNMVSVDELTNDQDYEEILEDIKEECGKFGVVQEVGSPSPWAEAMILAGGAVVTPPMPPRPPFGPSCGNTNDQDYEEILEDIKEECGKFGVVQEVKIPRPVKTC